MARVQTLSGLQKRIFFLIIILTENLLFFLINIYLISNTFIQS